MLIPRCPSGEQRLGSKPNAGHRATVLSAAQNHESARLCFGVCPGANLPHIIIMEVLKEKNLSLSSALRLFLKNVAVTNEVDLLSEEELEKEYLFRQLQAEVQESYAKIEAGNYLTDEDVVTRYGL